MTRPAAVPPAPTLALRASQLAAFLVPGVALLAGTPLVLATPLVAAVCYRLCIPHEEARLAEHFGEAYRAYRDRVGGIVPRPGWEKGA